MFCSNRRRAMTMGIGAVAAYAAMPLFARGNGSGETAEPIADEPFEVEFLRGDPLLPDSPLPIDPLAIQNLISGEKKASFQTRLPMFGRDLVQAASLHVGKNRKSNEDEITAFLELFDLSFLDDNSVPVAFCAAGLSYVAASLYASKSGSGNVSLSSLRNALGDVDHHHFYPSPSVMDMKHVAMGKRRWLARSQAIKDKKEPQPGWLVVFNWNGDGKSDHVGLVESFKGSTLHTIEFNTSITTAGSQSDGGAIARRTRPYDETIEGFIRPELKRIV